ncbi:MAG: 2-C-methyl-D-erythritol 4-phosphate cytidylyltransferase, partial [Chlamydiia bacterium]|nr:2-C-methyl-D-erythritol 4-phosphate cytidylyltransferase [Chlamydiia bacterium]
MKTAAIILIGGSGQRFGHSLPKQFHHLSGKKVYSHTLETFVQSDFFERIILVCHPDFIEQVQQETHDVTVIAGGRTRQESSYLGILAAAGSDIVVIHD